MSFQCSSDVSFQAMQACSCSAVPGARRALLWLWSSAERLQPTALTYSILAGKNLGILPQAREQYAYFCDVYHTMMRAVMTALYSPLPGFVASALSSKDESVRLLASNLARIQNSRCHHTVGCNLHIKCCISMCSKML